MTKYLIMPGFCKSKNDGETHFIDAVTLIRLYGVDKKDCTIYNESFSSPVYSKWIVLGPRFKGDYKEHLEKFQ